MGETEVMLEVGIKAAKVHAVLFANDMGDGIQLAHKPTQPTQGRPDMSPFRRGFDVPEAMVLVRCRRCRKPDAQYSVDPRDGTGQWKVRNGFNCRCEPPPVRPSGSELAKLVASAREKRNDPNGRFTDISRAPIAVAR